MSNLLDRVTVVDPTEEISPPLTGCYATFEHEAVSVSSGSFAIFTP
jgi:hypothetical protein